MSHGRGGAGNITADDTQYADAEIVRAADEGTGVSTGRGGTFFWVVHNVVRDGFVIYERRRPPMFIHIECVPLQPIRQWRAKKRAGKIDRLPTLLNLV